MISCAVWAEDRNGNSKKTKPGFTHVTTNGIGCRWQKLKKSPGNAGDVTLRYIYAFFPVRCVGCVLYAPSGAAECSRGYRCRLRPRGEIHGLQHDAACQRRGRAARLDGGRPLLV